jgi:putative oxidoreductase
MKTFYNRFVKGTGKLRDLSLLLFRLILAYGFHEPAIMKLKNPAGVAQWFDSMNYPLPTFSAYLSMITEVSGIILLVAGLGSRIVALPMMFIMVVAALTVHLSNGFAAGDNGFEIPLYYFLMLLSLVAFGSGRYSVDHLIAKRSGASSY